MIDGLRVTLLVTGSIAAYKSAELVREFVTHGAVVRVGMTKAAAEFITPLTLETLSGRPVIQQMFLVQGQNVNDRRVIDHIELADEADVVIVAPATADVIAKAAAGIADDIVSCTLLATKAPIVVAPAMNVNMWENPVTQENVNRLKKRGVTFIEPGVGDLACGWQGAGRLAGLPDIVSAVDSVTRKGDLAGYQILVTAGPTEEPIDPIRFVSNRSSGKMGYALARAARARGAAVTLISGPTELDPPKGIAFRRVRTAQEMRDEVFDQISRESDTKKRVVLMSSAVCDHAPATKSERKLKADKKASYALDMEPNPDILKELGEYREKQNGSQNKSLSLVGFAAETETGERLVSAAQEKLRTKKCDLIVANAADEALGLETNHVFMVDARGVEEIPTASKDIIARKILDRVLSLG